MAFTVNHYELLAVRIDASTEEVKAAYNEKIMHASGDMADKYKTAYYILSDPVRRQKYDLKLGIHKYRNVPVVLRIGKALARVILTLLDAIFSFYWCFLIVVVLAVVIYNLYLYKNQGIVFDFIKYVAAHKDEIIILAGFAGVDMATHFYVRRANRYLKHYAWEYIVKEDTKHE